MTKQELKNIKAIIFDLDETLLDAQKGLKAAQKETAEKITKHYPPQQTGLKTKQITQKLSEFDDEMNRKRKYDRNEWWPLFLKRLGVEEELDDSLIDELTETYWSAYIDSATPYQSAESVLDYLNENGYLIGLLTDTDGSGIPKRERIEPLSFSDLFDAVVVGGEDTSNSKPGSECFQLMVEKLGVEPERCCMIGDKPFTDIKGANSVGMKTVLVERRKWDSEEEPDFRIKSLDEVKNLF